MCLAAAAACVLLYSLSKRALLRAPALPRRGVDFAMRCAAALFLVTTFVLALSGWMPRRLELQGPEWAFATLPHVSAACAWLPVFWHTPACLHSEPLARMVQEAVACPKQRRALLAADQGHALMAGWSAPAMPPAFTLHHPSITFSKSGTRLGCPHSVQEDSAGAPISVCMGAEWGSFPSSFYLQGQRYRLEYFGPALSPHSDPTPPARLPRAYSRQQVRAAAARAEPIHAQAPKSIPTQVMRHAQHAALCGRGLAQSLLGS